MALVRKPKPAVKMEYDPREGSHESEVEEISNQVIDVDAMPTVGRGQRWPLPAVTTVPTVISVPDNTAEES